MSRKDVFANLKPPEPASGDASADVRLGKTRIRPILGSPDLIKDTSHSPVGAISQSLSEVNERGRRAEEIERRLAEGQAVVLLDTSEIEPSFVPDRMPGEIDGLVASIREQGQQVPILVRPHPELQGRYQVAFGHRRLRAVSELGKKINAIVRDLSDEQLVVAQGQENNERQDLTYIEKARFADRLKQRFSRDVIMSAMSLYKSDLSNMLSVVSRIPADLIEAVGPSPGVGRRSWIELADLLSEDRSLDRATKFLNTSELQVLPSEERFKALIAHLKPRPNKEQAEVWSSNSGERLAKVTRTDAKVELVINRKEAPEFAAFVLERLRSLFEEHASEDGRKNLET